MDTNIQSHNTGVTMVHPLLGYVHKDLNLKLFYYSSSKTTASHDLQLILSRVKIYYEVE
jgi:hypothetical protein